MVHVNRRILKHDERLVILLTFDAEASIPGLPSPPVVIKVTRHVDRAFSVVAVDLAIPGRLETF